MCESRDYVWVTDRPLLGSSTSLALRFLNLVAVALIWKKNENINYWVIKKDKTISIKTTEKIFATQIL